MNQLERHVIIKGGRKLLEITYKLYYKGWKMAISNGSTIARDTTRALHI